MADSHICVNFLASKSEDYNIDCLAFALLSHGEDKGNIHGTDRVISIDSLLSPLVNDTNMKHFAGKPKLLFVQVTFFYGQMLREVTAHIRN